MKLEAKSRLLQATNPPKPGMVVDFTNKLVRKVSLQYSSAGFWQYIWKNVNPEKAITVLKIMKFRPVAHPEKGYIPSEVATFAKDSWYAFVNTDNVILVNSEDK